MELSLTSLIPTVVELISFWQTNWPHIWWYPNWYLGVPYRFLTGPVVPPAVILLKTILPFFTIESAYICFIILSWLCGALGCAFLTKQLGADKRSVQLSALLFIVWPFWIFLLSTGNGLGHISMSLLPWVLLSFIEAIEKWSFSRGAKTTGLITLSLLITTASLLSILVGMAAVFILYRKSILFEVLLIRFILIVISALSLATVWYSPHLWLVMLGNPSFGGKPLLQIISWLGQVLEVLLPLALAGWVVRKRVVSIDKLMGFVLLFGGSFGFLTLIRFLSDVDFWIDWTGFFLELQVALALGLSIAVNRYIKKHFVILLIILILTISDGVIVGKIFFNPATKIYEQQIQNLLTTTDYKSASQRVFLSGSPVFWLANLSCDPGTQIHFTPGVKSSCIPGLLQVRGGKDEVATHKTWAMGVYNIREGESGEIMRKWLDVFGVSYVLVNDETSREFFRDFKSLDRFQGLEKVGQDSGNQLYKYKGSIARLASREKLLNLSAPTNGVDETRLNLYKESLLQPLEMKYNRATEIVIKLDQSLTDKQAISLAITYDPGWKSQDGQIRKDAFGNMILIPMNSGREVTLTYKNSWWGSIAAMLFSIILGVLLVKSDKLAQLVRFYAPSLQVTGKDEEIEY